MPVNANGHLMDRYAVMGNPIAHSLSPFIHTEFAKETDQDLEYTKIEVPLDCFAEYVYQFQKQLGRGLNITVPFKQQAFELVSSCSKEAEIAEAVNTLSFRADGSIHGDNTDGIGLVRDLLSNQCYSLKDKNILIFGAGGAVRGILLPLLNQSPNMITIANRTQSKAQKLVEKISLYGAVQATSFDALKNKYDLIINGTSLGLSEHNIPFNPTVLSKDSFCYDLIYRQEPTPFLKWALHHGVKRVVDGIGMLVEQAAESFYIWRGVRPETSKVIQLLKSKGA